LKIRITAMLALLLALVLAACAPMPTTPAGQEPTTVAPTEVVAEAAATPLPAEEAAPEEPAATDDTRPIVPAPVDGERPLAELSAAEREERFSGPAETYVKPDTVYMATIVTAKGNIVAELYQDTPESLNNFVTLALNGYYDGLTFHRVEPGFVVQGGDPAGTGMGGPGYTTPAEILHNHPRGALAWARTGDEINPERRSSGSQFYITLDVTEFLDNAYTVFGFVIEGMDIVDQIAIGDVIERIDISEGSASQLPTPVPTPTPYAPTAEEGRPLAALSLEQRDGVYNTAPELDLDTTTTYQATIETDKGNIVMELNAEAAPLTVSNFVLLANLGYYDGMPVAHVQADTYLIIGSPAGRPDSDVGYSLEIETPAAAQEVVTGTVAMYPVPDSTGALKASGSQFFISFMAMPESATPLDIFGTVTEGMDIVLQLGTGDLVNRITITEQ
jgi:cyclophilin family peptidyl-prolyl cis-trans isomerase